MMFNDNNREDDVDNNNNNIAPRAQLGTIHVPSLKRNADLEALVEAYDIVIPQKIEDKWERAHYVFQQLNGRDHKEPIPESLAGLTVPQIQSILLSHNIRFSPNYTKNDLIELVYDLEDKKLAQAEPEAQSEAQEQAEPVTRAQDFNDMSKNDLIKFMSEDRKSVV